MRAGQSGMRDQIRMMLKTAIVVVVCIHLGLLSRIFKAEREQMHVCGLLAVHGASVDGLRQELVHSVGGLVVHRRVTLLQRPLELLRHFALWTQITTYCQLLTKTHLKHRQDTLIGRRSQG